MPFNMLQPPTSSRTGASANRRVQTPRPPRKRAVVKTRVGIGAREPPSIPRGSRTGQTRVTEKPRSAATPRPTIGPEYGGKVKRYQPIAETRKVREAGGLRKRPARRPAPAVRPPHRHARGPAAPPAPARPPARRSDPPSGPTERRG